MTEIYDRLGTTYNATRRTDPRLEQVIWSALGDCGSGSAEALPFDDRSFDGRGERVGRHWQDCQDGFGAAYWRRPRAYLDPAVRAGMSMLAQTEHERGDGLERLRRDLSDGSWTARHRALLDQAELDCGYRIVIGEPGG